MGIWELADLPEGRKPIECKWVFVKKCDEKGNLIKYKAQLVAQGFSQKPGINFNNDGTFAPVTCGSGPLLCMAVTSLNLLSVILLSI